MKRKFLVLLMTLTCLQTCLLQPFSYIIGLFYSLVGYSYFLLSRGQVFDLTQMKESWTARFKVTSLMRV